MWPSSHQVRLTALFHLQQLACKSLTLPSHLLLLHTSRSGPEVQNSIYVYRLPC